VSLTDELLGPLLRKDPAAPRITYYDDASGERVELSGTTLANWAAKSANLLREECDLEPGGRVATLLPAHWQTAAVLLGAWWCGAEVVADSAGANVVLADAEHLDAAAANGARAVVGLSLDAFGRGISSLPAGVLDYAVEVRMQADNFVVYDPVPASALALQDYSVADVVSVARARAGELGLSRGDRVLSTLDWTVPQGLLDGLLSVLAVGGSLVQCRHAHQSTLQRRVDAERVTARLG
jgi:uncharacterized protein (TIGR03089 family)